MNIRQYTLALILLLLSMVSWADTQLIDPVTKKTLTYYSTSTDVKSNTLNPFEDIDVVLTVIRDHKPCSDNIKAFVTGLLESEAYKNRLKEHATQTITNYLQQSREAKNLSVYDKKLLLDQAILLEDIDCNVVSYYNNLLCIRIESVYGLNNNLSRYKEKRVMYQAIYVDVTTGHISTLLDLCPKALQSKFINALTAEKNKVIPLVSKQYGDDDEEGEDNGDEETDGVSYERGKRIVQTQSSQSYLKEKINLSDLLFDVNAMNFCVMQNASNTAPTNGNAFVFYLKEDSMARYLPFVLNRQKEKINPKLDVKKVNKQLMKHDRPYSFLYNDYTLAYFENTKNKKNVSVYFRQDLISDTTFKLIERLSFTDHNNISRTETSIDAKGKAGNVKRYKYKDNLLQEIEVINNNKSGNSLAYIYNQQGNIIKYLADPEEDEAEEYNYRYNDLSVTECRMSDGENKCYTYLFDSLGNFLSFFNTGTKPSYISIYDKTMLMARGDALYSYNAMNQVTSMENDAGRYYTNYSYDKENRMSQILSYDGKKLKARQAISYDALGRMILILQTNYNDYDSGKIETQVEYKLVYTD